MSRRLGFYSPSVDLTSTLTREDFTQGGSILVKVRFHGRDIAGADTNLVWSGLVVPDASEPAESRVVSYGYYERTVSGFDGDIRVNTCRLLFSDYDHTIRGWLDSSTQYGLLNAQVDVEWIREVDWRAGGIPWRKYFRGEVARYKPEGGNLFSFEVNGVGTAQTNRAFPLPKLSDDFLSLPQASSKLYAPFVTGRKSDEGSATPPPQVTNESVSGSGRGPEFTVAGDPGNNTGFTIDYGNGANRAGFKALGGTVPTGFTITDMGASGGDFTPWQSLKYYGMVTFTPSGGSEGDPSTFLPRNCSTLTGLSSPTSTIKMDCTSTGAGGTYHFYLGVEFNNAVEWTQRIDTASNTATFDRKNELAGYNPTTGTISTGAVLCQALDGRAYTAWAVMSDGRTSPSRLITARQDGYRRPYRITINPVDGALSYGFARTRGGAGTPGVGSTVTLTATDFEREYSVPSTQLLVTDAAMLALSPADFWKLDLPSGSSATDSGSGAHNATVNGTPTLHVAQANGRYGIQFDGVNDYLTFASAAASGTTFSMSLWLTPDDSQFTVRHYLFTQASNANGLFWNPGSHKFEWYNGAFQAATAAAANLTLVNVIVVCSGGTATIYYNNVVAGTFTGVTSFTPTDMGDGGGGFMKGIMSDVIYAPGVAWNATQRASILGDIYFDNNPTDVSTGTEIQTLQAPHGQLPLVPCGGAYTDLAGVATDWRLFLISYGWDDDTIEGVFQSGTRLTTAQTAVGGNFAVPGLGGYSALFGVPQYVIINSRRYWGVYVRGTDALDAESGDRPITANVRRAQRDGLDILSFLLDNFVLPTTPQTSVGGGWLGVIPTWPDGTAKRDQNVWGYVTTESATAITDGRRGHYIPAGEVRPTCGAVLKDHLIGTDVGLFWEANGAVAIAMHPPAPLGYAVLTAFSHVDEILAEGFDIEDDPTGVFTKLPYDFDYDDVNGVFRRSGEITHESARLAYRLPEHSVAPRLEFKTISDTITARQVAVRALYRMCRTERTTTVPRFFHAIHQEPGTRYAITHPEGTGASGYVTRDLQIRRVVSDIDQMTVTAGCYDLAWIAAAHADAHTDSAHVDEHTDTHDDVTIAHNDGVSHSDGHGDAHVDSHTDVAHGDSHTDAAHADHNDSYHEDLAHGDGLNFENHTHDDYAHQDFFDDDGHFDTGHDDTHTDTAHSDVTHVDTHTDTHADSGGHGDTAASHTDAHGDTAHVDTAHVDVHTDDPHGDQ